MSLAQPKARRDSRLAMVSSLFGISYYCNKDSFQTVKAGKQLRLLHRLAVPHVLLVSLRPMCHRLYAPNARLGHTKEPQARIFGKYCCFHFILKS